MSIVDISGWTGSYSVEDPKIIPSISCLGWLVLFSIVLQMILVCSEDYFHSI